MGPPVPPNRISGPCSIVGSSFLRFLRSKKAPQISKKSFDWIFEWFWRGTKNGAAFRAPKNDILLPFTTLGLGPAPQKGTPFWSHFGDRFHQKNRKRGFQTKKQQKHISNKHSKWVPNIVFFSFLLFDFGALLQGTASDTNSRISSLSQYWLRFEPQKVVLGPLDSPL